jgi:hypothetical protein
VAKWVPYVALWYDDNWQDISADVYDRDDIMIRRGKTNEASAPVPTSANLTLKNWDNRYDPEDPMSPLWGKIGRNTPIIIGFDPVDEDFEDTTYQFAWTYGATGAWTRSSTRARHGTWSFRSPTITDGQTATIRIPAPAGANTVSFWVWASISSGSFAAVYTEAGLQWFVSGDRARWELVTVDVGASAWVQLDYIRSASGGSNAVWIDDVRAIDARAAGEVWKWEPDHSDDFRAGPPVRGDAWCRLSVGGLLRRIGQASEVTDSPIYRAVQHGGMDPVEYWPMEDPEGVYGVASAVGGAPMTPITAVVYTLPGGAPVIPGGLPKMQADGGVPGANPLIGFTDGGTLQGTIRPMPAGAYGIDLVVRFKPGGDAGGTASVDFFRWSESGTYSRFTFNATSSGIDVFHSTPADDALASFTGSAHAGLNPYDGAPHHVRYQVSQNGANYRADLYVDGFYYATSENFATPGSMAGTVGRPTVVEFNHLSDVGDALPVAAGHLIVWPVGSGQPDTFTPTFGYPREEADARLRRFGDEEGWPVVIRERGDSTERMGPQLVDTMPKMLETIETTEDGLLFDQRGAVAVELRTRHSQYAQASRIDLDYGTDALQPIRRVYDDQTTANEVTAKNRDGQLVTVVVEGGRLAATDPADGGVGRYPQTIDVNVADGVSALTQQAWWWANKGTVEGARYPVIVADLDADPTLADTLAQLDMGDRFRVLGLGYDPVDVRVLGVQERLGHRRRTVTFNCGPFRQYDVALYVARGGSLTGTKRQDSRNTTLNAGYNTTVGTMVLTYPNVLDEWSTAAVPYDLDVEGERITVTAMTARTGAGPYTQTATVTRSVNGVVKSHLAGEPVHIHPDQLARYAL